jgi:hypothetical protein
MNQIKNQLLIIRQFYFRSDDMCPKKQVSIACETDQGDFIRYMGVVLNSFNSRRAAL